MVSSLHDLFGALYKLTLFLGITQNILSLKTSFMIKKNRFVLDIKFGFGY